MRIGSGGRQAHHDRSAGITAAWHRPAPRRGGTDEIGEIIEALAARELIEILEDGDVHLTAFGCALTESSDE